MKYIVLHSLAKITKLDAIECVLTPTGHTVTPTLGDCLPKGTLVSFANNLGLEDFLAAHLVSASQTSLELDYFDSESGLTDRIRHTPCSLSTELISESDAMPSMPAPHKSAPCKPSPRNVARQESPSQVIVKQGVSRITASLDVGMPTGISAQLAQQELLQCSELSEFSVIYRLLDADTEDDYTGPFMVDAEGVVRVSGELTLCSETNHSFLIEALMADGTSSRSDEHTIIVCP